MIRLLLCGLSFSIACDQPGGGTGVFVPSDAADSSDEAFADATADTSPEVLDDSATPDTFVPDTFVPDTFVPETVEPETVEGPPPVTSPTCIDGTYSEALPNDRADIDSLIDGYSSADYLAFTDAVLAARYPFGGFLVREANEGGAGGLGNCITAFTSDRGTARGLIGELSTVVHECGHVYDTSFGSFSSDFYALAGDVTFECARGDATDRGGDTFARSRLNDDAFGAFLPGDFYRDVYLDGDPDDARFDGGDQGFNSVLEEATQYVNSLATDWAFKDQLVFSVSARDGILTFLWYIERYLHMARRSFPDAYDRLSGDPCWREVILTLWGRAWLYLGVSADANDLGLDDDAIEQLVLMEDLLEEIDLIREAHGCE